MIAALCSGTIIRDPKSGTSASGTRWANSTIRVPCGTNREGEAETAFVSVIAFGDVADQLARLGKGDAIAVQGPMKPTTYDKDGEERHGLEIIAQAVLTPYTIKKKRGDQSGPKPVRQTQPAGRHEHEFDDTVTF